TKMEALNFYRTASDHNAIIFYTEVEVSCRRRRFVFDKSWVKQEGITDVVMEGWQVSVDGSQMYQVHQKIKNTRMALLSWHKPLHRNSEKAVKVLTEKMEEMRNNGLERDWEEWASTKAELDQARKEEENYWRLKSRALWLKERDQNSRFFHAFTAQRRKSNSIYRLVTNGGVVCDSKDTIETHMVEFYTSLFTSEGSSANAETLQHISRTIIDDHNSILVQPIEEKEIKAAVFMMESDKAPREDGMTVYFFKHFWNIIKDDVCAAVKSFFLSGNMLKNWKHTVITSILKCLYPDSLSNFRPISLCGVLYKVVANIIAQRLKLCLNSCISSAQTAFVPGRSLLDNVVNAQEVFYYFHKHRSGPHAFMAIKLDMEKAYNRVEWICIKVIMRKMGFHGKFINWILSCISHPTFSFNLNGANCGFVKATRGIRQGDPLSPYLFIIVSEVLSSYLHYLMTSRQFKGIKIAKNAPMLSHLLFADDALVFCKADDYHARLMLNILHNYKGFTGQKVNLHKSSMFLSRNCRPDMVCRISAILSGVVVKRSSRYLGLPLGIGAFKRDAFQFVEESVKARIESWKNNLLSPAGKEVLIKSVLQALPIFVMSCFLLPIGLCKRICRLMAKFWWSKGSSQENSLHWKAWEKMVIPKINGGLGFLDIQTLNKALILKQL
ncbi:DNAse I-like superfamily protein, partial [Striga hermonthica]